MREITAALIAFAALIIVIGIGKLHTATLEQSSADFVAARKRRASSRRRPRNAFASRSSFDHDVDHHQNTSSSSSSRRLSNCKWDTRKGATVCIKADGSTWIGPAADPTEKITPRSKTISVFGGPAAAQQAEAKNSPSAGEKRWDVPWKAMLKSSSSGGGGGGGGGSGGSSGGGGGQHSSSSSSSTRTNYRKMLGDAIPCGSKPKSAPSSSSGFSGARAVRRVILFVVDDLQPDGVSAFRAAAKTREAPP